MMSMTAIDGLSIKQKSSSLNKKTVKKREALYSKATRSIPLEVVIEILSWLPFKSLQRFKCVCRAWFDLLTKDSYLAKLHCKRVMVGMARKYDFDLEIDIVSLQRFSNIYESHIYFESHFRNVDPDFSDKVYECFYGNCTTYTRQSFVRQLNAYDFFQRYSNTRYGALLSFCNGLYEIAEYRRFDMVSHVFSFASIHSSTLVLVPTRQAGWEIRECAGLWNVYGVYVLLLDFVNIRFPKFSLSTGDLFIGTPGCVNDNVKRRSIRLDLIDKLVLLEADEMFSRGYTDEIYGILKLLPKKVKVRIITATIPAEAVEIPRIFWNKSKEEWRTEPARSNATVIHLPKFQIYKNKPPSNALEELKESLRVLERIKKVKCDKELASMIAFGKLKNKERRKRTSTISWNPHLKMHM
ncbi:translation initiation factor eIF4A [Ranunculus cassubicifolius]